MSRTSSLEHTGPRGPALGCIDVLSATSDGDVKVGHEEFDSSDIDPIP